MLKDVSRDSYGETVDLLVVGGGVNGCGIARDAAGRGLSVILCEQGDLACATSSASSKLIHGGLRYLESFDFRLVREALSEREVLMAAAPHIVRPLTFVLPHCGTMRPWWQLRAGLFLYDRLGRGRTLSKTKVVPLAGPPLKPDFHWGFAYVDAFTDDARLVALVALDAAERGAKILTRTRLISATRKGGRWLAQFESAGTVRTICARALVNATGPWVREVAASLEATKLRAGVKLVKGSHILVPRLYPGDHAYTLQGPDRRVIFTVPFEERYTLVGTTDVPLDVRPSEISCSQVEVAYLLQTLNRYFNQGISAEDVIWRYAGVRPLYDDGRQDASAMTRDYVIELEAGDGAPLISIIGGKLTTFRRLSENVLERLKPLLGFSGASWTERAKLPGGDMEKGFEAFLQQMGNRYPWIPRLMLRRMCGAYGSRLVRILQDARSLNELGHHHGATLYQREVDYLREIEWANTGEDILMRRTKLWFHMSPNERAAFVGSCEAPYETGR